MPPYLDPEQEKAKKRRWFKKKRKKDAAFRAAENHRPRELPNRHYCRFNLDTEAEAYLALVAALKAAGIPRIERTNVIPGTETTIVTVSFEKPKENCPLDP